MSEKLLKVINPVTDIKEKEENLTDEDLRKIELLNTLHHKVITNFTDEDGCYGVVVPLDNETTGVLKKLGLTNADIGHRMRVDKENSKIVINLTELGFPFAKWWHPEKGFSLTMDKK